jgi:hypothetical protein
VLGGQEAARGDKKKLNERWRLEDRKVELLELRFNPAAATSTAYLPLKIRRKEDQTN